MPTGDDAGREYGKLYPVARAILSPIFRTGWRTYVRGAENLPTPVRPSCAPTTRR